MRTHSSMRTHMQQYYTYQCTTKHTTIGVSTYYMCVVCTYGLQSLRYSYSSMRTHIAVRRHIQQYSIVYLGAPAYTAVQFSIPGSPCIHSSIVQYTWVHTQQHSIEYLGAPASAAVQQYEDTYIARARSPRHLMLLHRKGLLLLVLRGSIKTLLSIKAALGAPAAASSQGPSPSLPQHAPSLYSAIASVFVLLHQ